MPTSHYSSSTETTVKPIRRLRLGRIAGWLALAAVLALSFVGYLTPQMQVQWANFMSLCGF
ncbi:hypothetical protein EKL30_13270 [Candidimonas sp. SYP-B2681]|uniref:hypothetical protein n=1 Tax=Candidimonas sp. SYP-B2681 TaxID=2497686 RepID=UPI000F86D28F|nr:hypothetical protein [Candidimonas sp. SYP-B2681]RTZ41538.1 hypothetical protein EKL30_13270 [Candidimonas sp. SYP-B2681]